jgi:dynein heavy chain
VKAILPKIIESVLSVYDKVKLELLPTPSKSHYTFNLRDIWRVFQGICSAHQKSVSTPQALLKLWFH